ncbi:DUF2490 domain-containing protein [Neotamlana sedimentorum]|nr:DUF2490 domain-containing protein [Tamlana sedimentorum]
MKNQDRYLHRRTSMRYFKPLLFLLLFYCLSVSSQNNLTLMGESSISVNHKATKNYSVNFAARSRYFLNPDNSFGYKQQQIDLYHFSTFKLNINHDLSLGIYYRNRDLFNTGIGEVRFTQQFNYKKQKHSFRFGHRVRAEQRILDTKTIFRQRYRFAIDFPLNGEKLDIGEPYLFFALEGLWSFSKKDTPEFDERTITQIGWQISETLKLQTGLEYRLEAFNIIAKHSLYLLTSAVLKL